MYFLAIEITRRRLASTISVLARWASRTWVIVCWKTSSRLAGAILCSSSMWRSRLLIARVSIEASFFVFGCLARSSWK